MEEFAQVIGTGVTEHCEGHVGWIASALIQGWAAITRGHCHPPLKKTPKCFVSSSTSAGLGFGGSF